MELGQSLEDYLEAAYLISDKHPTRNIDIVVLLNRSKPSVSVAVKELVKKGYVSIKRSVNSLTVKQKFLHRCPLHWENRSAARI